MVICQVKVGLLLLLLLVGEHFGVYLHFTLFFINIVVYTTVGCMFSNAADMLFATGLHPVKSVEYSTMGSDCGFTVY
jgi:hypothetical protein